MKENRPSAIFRIDERGASDDARPQSRPQCPPRMDFRVFRALFGAMRFAVWTTLALIPIIALGCGESAPDTPPTAIAIAPPPTAAPEATRTPTPEPAPTAPPSPTATSEPTRTPAPPTAILPTASPVPIPVPPTPFPTPDPRARGGTLNIASEHDIAHQDVHADVSPALAAWGPGIAYSRLMRLRTGEGVALPSLAVECDLCASWEMESPTSFRFELRENARWHGIAPVDGRPVSAHDVAYSYARQSEPSMPNAPLLGGVADIRALDDRTLRITTRLPDADALLAFADGHSKIVAREAAEMNGDLRDGPTIGSGAWIYDAESAPDTRMFARNEDYYESGVPYLDKLVIHILPDRATRSAAFQTAHLDVAEMNTAEWREYAGRNPSAPFLIAPQPGAGLEMAFKTTAPPFDNIALRRAAMLAMEPRKAIAEHWGGFGGIGAAFPMASADWRLPRGDAESRFAQPSAALGAVAASGEIAPFPLTITVGDYGEPYLAHAHAVSVELRRIGFEPTVDIVNRRDFGERVWLGGDYQLMMGPPAPASAPNGYLLTTLHSEGIWNTTEHRDAELDALLESQAVELNPAKRAELVRRIQTRALDMAYRFMPASGAAIWTWNPRVRDFHPNFAASEYGFWMRVWVVY